VEGPVVSSWAAPLILAPFVGSFLGVLICRLPAGGSVAWSRSACEGCGATLGARDLVPLASFLAGWSWTARSRDCREIGGAEPEEVLSSPFSR
jgi:leader peptidase (prepilin peptidase)/N-methyltransferase